MYTEMDYFRSCFKKLKLEHKYTLDLVRDKTSIDSLPVDVLMNLLGRLHWVDYLRCRLVSVSWNSILRAPLLRSQSSVAISSCEADGPCFVVTDGDGIYVRKSLSIWHLPFSGNQHWNQLPLICPSTYPTLAQWKLIATTSGLFLMSACQNERKYLLCNPVSKRVKELPPLPILPVSADLQMSGKRISRIVEVVPPMGNGGTYSRLWPKVIAFERYSAGLGSDTLNMWRFLKYDDYSSAWEVFSMLYLDFIKIKKLTTTMRIEATGVAVYYDIRDQAQEVRLEVKEVMLRNSAMVGQEILILLTSVKGPHRRQFSRNTGLLVPIEEWFSSVLFKIRPYSLVEVPLNDLDVSPYLQLFHHGGSLYIARGMTRRNSKVDIWKQNLEMTSWDEVSRMPELLAEELYRLMHPKELFRLHAEGDYVCFTRGYNFGLIIRFHVPTRTWARLDDFTSELRDFYSNSGFGPWYRHGDELDDRLQHFIWQPRLDSNM